MKEGQAIKEIESDGVLFRFRYLRWSDATAYVDMCNILHREGVRKVFILTCPMKNMLGKCMS